MLLYTSTLLEFFVISSVGYYWVFHMVSVSPVSFLFHVFAVAIPPWYWTQAISIHLISVSKFLLPFVLSNI